MTDAPLPPPQPHLHLTSLRVKKTKYFFPSFFHPATKACVLCSRSNSSSETSKGGKKTQSNKKPHYSLLGGHDTTPILTTSACQALLSAIYHPQKTVEVMPHTRGQPLPGNYAQSLLEPTK